MKRFLSLFIILVLVLSTLASCDWFNKDNGGDKQSTTTPTTPTTPSTPVVEEADIQEAVKQLDDLYEDLNGTSIPNGYELIAQIKVGKTVFPISWVSDNENVTFTYADGLCVINLGSVDADTAYTITGTLTSEGGQSATVSYNLILSAAASYGMITNPEVGVAYKLALLHGNEGPAVVYFDGQNYNGYDWYFNYTTDTQAAVDVYLETVEDVEGGLRLYFDNNGVKTYIVAFPRDGDTTKGTLKFDTAVPTEYWRYNTEYNTLVYTSVTGEQFYMGSSGTYKSISCSAISYISSATSYPVRLWGPGGVDIELPEQQLPTVPENYTSADIVDALYKLESGQTLEGPYEITGVITSFKYPYDAGYNNVSPVIVVEGREDKPVLCYRLTGGEELKVGDTITVFAGITNYGGTYETTSGGVIRNVVPGTGEVPTPPTPDKMTIPEVLASTEGTAVVVSGTVSEIYQAWSDQFNNISFYISDDQGNRLLVFRTGTKVVVGDQVTVSGTATVYNGTIQIAQGGTTVIDVPAGSGSDSTLVPTIVTTPAVDTAYKFGMIQGNLDNAVYYLAGGMAQTYYLATTTNYDSAIDLYLEAADNGYYLYTMVDGVKTYINMVVSGTHVNGAYDTTASTVYTWDETNHTLIASVTPEGGEAADYWFGTRNDKTYTTVGPCAVSYAGFFCQFYTLSENTQGGEGCGTETPTGPVEMSIPDALASAVGTQVIVKGQVIEVNQVWNTQFNNMTVTIVDEEGNELYVYRMGTQVVAGDFITVTGTVGEYNGAKQIAQGSTAVVTGHEDLVVDANCHILSFADVANRTVFTSSQQVWVANGVTLTNDQAASTSPVADYSAPARFYKSSKVTVEYTGMTKIVFKCNNASYAEALKASIEDTSVTVTLSGNDVTVEFAQAVDSFVIAKLSAQVRVDSVDVYTA